MRCGRDVFAVAFVFMTSDNKSFSLQNRREGKKFRFISKITNFLFHSCGERHFPWFSCFLAVLWWCAASAAACCASLNIIIFISSANYSVFPLWKAHERQTKLCCFTLPPSPPKALHRIFFFGNDNIKRRDLSTRRKKTLNIDTNSYDDSPTEIMWCGWKSRRILIFSLLFTAIQHSSSSSTTEGNAKSFRIHKCLNKLHRKKHKKLFSHNL